MSRNGNHEKHDHTVHTGSPAERVLAHAQAGREVVQDFCELASSLEWNLGQEYLRQRGNKAFLSDTAPVPFIVNNDGTLSKNAADVFFASLRDAEGRGVLETEIVALELGIGVGLFARYFLDHMKALSRQHKKDYYERLTYIAADRSPRMLHDVLRHGVLAEHPGRYRVRQVDAMEPEAVLREFGFATGGSARPFVTSAPSPPSSLPRGGEGSQKAGLRAVFLNYLLDCLPAAVLRFEGEVVKQLCVRTCVARNVRLADYTDLTPAQLRQRAEAAEGRARDELLEVYGLFASEYDYRPVMASSVPYGEFAVEYGRKRTKRLLHSYGAIQCLEKLLGMLADGGFILVNDYGPTQTSRDDEFEHQRFSLATFVGVNFPLLREYFGEQKRCVYLEPTGEEGRGIHARLLANATPQAAVGFEVRACFAERFGDAAHQRLQEPIQKARACAKAGRFELAAGFYREALALQPRNWVLLCEVSQFLTFQLRDPKAGADMAKVALALNPTCSAELWNALGDALYEFGRTEEARSAYEKALSVNAADVRARYNLAWVHTRLKDYPQALLRIAEALALDKTGEYRDRLLQKQQEVIALQTRRHQQEYLLLINLVSKHAKDEHDKPKESEPPLPAPTVVIERRE
jgi:tetratricopeptide (TPR) repeat protein